MPLEENLAYITKQYEKRSASNSSAKELSENTELLGPLTHKQTAKMLSALRTSEKMSKKALKERM